MKTTTLARTASLLLLALPVLLRAADEVKVDCEQKHQTMQGFGTCMKGWGDPEKNASNKWQGEQACWDLYAKDLGLTVARIPIDRWVLEGDNPYKIPSNLTDEVKNDPTKIKWENFRWEPPKRGGGDGKLVSTIPWCQNLLKVNPDIKIIMSVWSPPHWMKEELPKPRKGSPFTWSKFGSSSCGGRLAPKYYTHFAHFLAQWCLGLEKKFNIKLYALSIQNELAFYEPYDSCIYSGNEFAKVTLEVAKVFKELGVKTKIMGPEDMTHATDRTMDYLKPLMATDEGKAALDIINSHGYSDGIESNLQATDASKLRDLIKDFGKEYWMTETGGGCGYWESADGTKTDKKGKKMPGAFDGFAAMMHNAIAYGDASAWCTWQFTSEEEDSQHALVTVTMEELKPTKKFYVQKHYSKYVAPGSVRVDAGPDKDGLLASAFLNEAKGALTIVLQNHRDAEAKVDLSLNKSPASAFEVYTTNKTKNFEKGDDVSASGGKLTITLPAKSIVTLATKSEAK